MPRRVFWSIRHWSTRRQFWRKCYDNSNKYPVWGPRDDRLVIIVVTFLSLHFSRLCCHVYCSLALRGQNGPVQGTSTDKLLFTTGIIQMYKVRTFRIGNPSITRLHSVSTITSHLLPPSLPCAFQTSSDAPRKTGGQRCTNWQYAPTVILLTYSRQSSHSEHIRAHHSVSKSRVPPSRPMIPSRSV